jgi:hypothetical protein
MKSNTVMFRVTAAFLLTLVAATLVFLLTLYVHLRIYGALHPGETTEVDHNANLEHAVSIHFRVGYPLLLAIFGWLSWRFTGSWLGRANKPLKNDARENARAS